MLVPGYKQRDDPMLTEIKNRKIKIDDLKTHNPLSDCRRSVHVTVSVAPIEKQHNTVNSN